MRLTRRSGKYVLCEYNSYKCADQEEDGGCQYCLHMGLMMAKLAHYEDLEEQGKIPEENSYVGITD